MFSILKRSERQSGAMMDALGVDLETAVMRGQVSPDEREAITLRCATCAEKDDCDRRLRAPLDAAPDYCRNIDLFGQLTG